MHNVLASGFSFTSEVDRDFKTPKTQNLAL